MFGCCHFGFTLANQEILSIFWRGRVFGGVFLKRKAKAAHLKAKAGPVGAEQAKPCLFYICEVLIQDLL